MRAVQLPQLNPMPRLLVLSWVLPTPQTEIPAESEGIGPVTTPQKCHPPQALRSCSCSWPNSAKGLARSFLSCASVLHTEERGLSLGHTVFRILPCEPQTAVKPDPCSLLSNSSSSASGKHTPLKCTAGHYSSLYELGTKQFTLDPPWGVDPNAEPSSQPS